MIRRIPPSRLLLVLAVGLIPVMCPPLVYAQDDAFRDGLAAREEKKWQDVVRHMRRAIEMSSQESSRKVPLSRVPIFRRLGESMEYLPHYFLGEALFNLGECAAAVESWSRSQQQSPIRGRTDFLKVITDGYASCESKGFLPPGKYDPVFARTNQQVTEVGQEASSITALARANNDYWTAEMKAQYERAYAEIQNANSKLQAGAESRSQRDFTEASAAAERARSILVALESNLKAVIENQKSILAQAADVEQMIALAETSNRAIDDRKITLPQSLAGLRQSGQDAIARARDRVNIGKRASNPAALSEARSFAQDALARFRQVLDELTKLERSALDQQLSEALAGAQQAFALLDGALATFDRLRAERSDRVRHEMVTEWEAIQRLVNRARRGLDEARKAESVPGIMEATRRTSEPRDRLNVLIGAFGPITIIDRGVRPALEQAARAFFAGEYQEVLSALSASEGLQPEASLQLHVHLFKAASLFALFVRSRETDQSLLTQAQNEIERCKGLDRAFQPDARAFSPRFIAFFQNGTTALRPEGTASQR
jgi:hypothetical protein